MFRQRGTAANHSSLSIGHMQTAEYMAELLHASNPTGFYDKAKVLLEQRLALSTVLSGSP